VEKMFVNHRSTKSRQKHRFQLESYSIFHRLKLVQREIFNSLLVSRSAQLNLQRPV
jgi:hypothetical protein